MVYYRDSRELIYVRSAVIKNVQDKVVSNSTFHSNTSFTYRQACLKCSELMSYTAFTRSEGPASVGGLLPGYLVNTPARLLAVHCLVGALDLVPDSKLRASGYCEVLQHHPCRDSVSFLKGYRRESLSLENRSAVAPNYYKVSIDMTPIMIFIIITASFRLPMETNS